MSNLRQFLIVLLLLFFFHQPLGAEKWGLLIGINEYTYDEIPDLRGCENDVNLMQKVLTTKYGFSDDNIGLVLNGNATKENIVAALTEWLIEKPKADDTVVLYYSGHGVQTVDRNGDEDDGFDEALCPSDVKPNIAKTEFLNVLLDDELDELLSEIPTDNVTVILDCCHSGTATKSLVPVGMCSSKVIDRDLVLNPNPNKQRPSLVEPPKGSRKDLEDLSHVIITGCDDHEVSQERTWYTPDAGYFRSGVLTKHLVDELERNQTDLTYADLMNKVRKSIGTGAVQTPQIHGDTNRPIFSMRQSGGNIEPISAASKPYVLITETIRNKAILNAGSLHGVTKGSIYDVYPPTEVHFSGKPLAQIQISNVELKTSTADVSNERAFAIEQRTNPIPPRARAIEVQHAFPKDSLYIRIDGEPKHTTEFVRHLEIENVITIPDEERADFLLRLSPSFGRVNSTLIGADGRIVFQAHAESVEKLAGKLRRTVEREVLIKLLRSFRNPNPPFDLNVWVDKGENPTYQIGETMSIFFRAEIDCYLVLLDIDSEGHVTMMFPNKYHPDNRITGKQTYTIPSGNLRFKIRTHAPAGRELVMALATTKPLSNPIFQIRNQAEILADLTGANLGTELLHIVRESLVGKHINSSPSTTLSTNDWVTDSFIVILTQ